ASAKHFCKMFVQFDRSEFRVRLEFAKNEFGKRSGAGTVLKNGLRCWQAESLHHCLGEKRRTRSNRSSGAGGCDEFLKKLHVVQSTRSHRIFSPCSPKLSHFSF